VTSLIASIPPERLRRFVAASLVRDGSVALLAYVLTLALLATGNASRSLDPLGGGLAAVACFPLVARRRAPLAVFAVTTAASAALNGLGYRLGPPFGPTAALFFVALDERTRERIRNTAVVVVGLFAIHVGATTIPHSGFPTSPVLFGILVWGGAWVAGDQVRARRQRRLDLLERLRRGEAERERDRRLAAAEERTRIARDLHDSAAHAINVILVQAGAARLLQERDPASVRTALTTIEEVARETIGEIEHLIRGLREDDVARTVPATIEPPSGLAAVETLAERYRAAGLEVDTHSEGEFRSLPRGLDQAAYRILQESLTNAARHGIGPVRIDIHYRKRGLELTIANPAPSTGEIVEGHGILGMRERAALLGGTLEARVEGGLFRVHARLPYAIGGV
jgi:signal transduction histidine kinase